MDNWAWFKIGHQFFLCRELCRNPCRQAAGGRTHSRLCLRFDKAQDKARDKGEMGEGLKSVPFECYPYPPVFEPGPFFIYSHVQDSGILGPSSLVID